MTYVPRSPGYKFLIAHAEHDGDECVIWPFTVCTPGYGTFCYNKTKATLAHRFMCELRNGAPPSRGHQASHSCGNRRCVNPKHLSWKTPADNQKDRKLHGTNNKTTSKITPMQAEQIKRLKGMETSVQTAARYGITESNVRLIQDGKTWRTVDRGIIYWTKEDDETLRGLVAAGKTFAEAGRIMGRNVNQRAQRLGLKSIFKPHAPRGPMRPRTGVPKPGAGARS